MATKKKNSKKDLEAKIARLEAKLSKLSAQSGGQTTISPPPPKQTPPPPKQTPPPPKQTPPPPPPPPKQTPSPKPTETAPPQKPVWLQWQDSPMGDWNIQKTKVPGYVSAPNRYYASKVVLNADVPTTDWNLQKVKVPGYTAPSNKYFATRARLAYHPHEKSFGTWIVGTQAQVQTQTAPPPPPPKPDAALPKGTVSSSGGSEKSKKDELADYEADYLARLDHQHAEYAAAEESAKAAEEAQSKPSSNKGSLPKGF